MTNLLLAIQSDDLATVVSVGGFLIVIVVIMVLSLFFVLLGKFMSSDLKLRKTVKKTHVESTNQTSSLDGKLSADTTAAIAAAVYQYLNDAKDEENTIITIARAPKSYSPWSSKIYGTHKSIFNSGRR